MSDRIFIDSNIFVYSLDGSEEYKQTRAGSILARLSPDKGVISTQVLQEFFNVATTKLKCPKSNAKELVQSISESFPVHKNSVFDILNAIEISIKTGFSFWDSLIISAAIAENCDTLYSEDLNDGQIVESVTIKNPFKN